jgi:signal transduction histidine kinase/ligand-binding sensor domain-containing protein
VARIIIQSCGSVSFLRNTVFLRLWLLTAALTLPCEAGQFAPAVNYSLAGFPHWICSGDVNGDGREDILSVCQRPPRLDVLLGKGDGSFQPPLSQELPFGCSVFTTADLDGDGKLDLAIARPPDRLLLLGGDGHGQFALMGELEVTGFPHFILATDLNGDNRPDLLLTRQSERGFAVFINEGGGKFARPRYVDTGETPAQMAVGDLDEDGIVDLAITDGDNDNVAILWGRGNGEFAPPERFTGFFRPRALQIAGRRVYVLSRAGRSLRTLRFEQRRGIISEPVAAGLGPTAIAVVDINRDGILDVLSANACGDDVGVLFGRSGDLFDPTSREKVQESPTCLVTGDFNRDGYPDVAVANGGARSISILLNRGPSVETTNHPKDDFPPLLRDAQARLHQDAEFSGQYLIRRWTTEDGLPMNRVNSMAQSRDGWFWLGTQNGLARFDGVHFQVFDKTTEPAFPSNDCRYLTEDAQGTLWIGTPKGLLRLNNRRFSRYSQLPGGAIQALAASPDGSVWGARDYRLFRIRKDKPQFIQAPDYAAFSSFGFDSLNRLVMHSGTPYEGFIVRATIDRQGKANIIHSEMLPPMHTLGEPMVASDDSVWVPNPDGLHRFNTNGHMNVFLAGWDGFPHQGLLAAEDKSGAIWVATKAGLARCDGKEIRTLRGANSPAGELNLCYVDHEGTVWTSGAEGLFAVRPRGLRVFTREDGLPSDDVWSISSARDGSVFVGTDRGVCRISKGSLEPLPYSARSIGGGIHSVLAAGERLFVSEKHLFTLDNLHSVPVSEINGLPFFRVDTLYLDKEANIWFTSGGELCSLRDTNLVVWNSHNGFNGKELVGVLEDCDGHLWVGSHRGEVFVRDGSGWKKFGSESGITVQHIAPVFADTNGAVWFGSEAGLFRCKEQRFYQFRSRDGVFEDVVLNVLQDDHGWFWLNGHRGIYRIQKESLDAVADGRVGKLEYIHYDERDGMLSAEGNGGTFPNSCKTPDGKLWFPTTHGLVMIDPAQITRNLRPPDPLIEAASAIDGIFFGEGSSIGSEIPAGSGGLVKIRFTASTSIAPEKLQFRYKLEGQDRDWKEVPPRAERAALYTNLKPGPYRFSLLARNADGVWSSNQAILAFSVAPFYYQRWQFKLASASAILLAALIVHRRILQHKNRLQSLEHQLAFERERSRIARDIHDDIGSTLTRIQLLSGVVKEEMAQPDTLPNATSHVEKIVSSAREVAEKMDEIVWAVNPSHDSLPSFVDYICHFSQEMLQLAGMKCVLDIPATVPDRHLPSEWRHNLFLVFKEALNNAIKHSGASEVKVAMEIDPPSLIIDVADNGKGFQGSAEGHGLPNLRSRVAQLNGNLAIQSQETIGTRINVQVTLP